MHHEVRVDQQPGRRSDPEDPQHHRPGRPPAQLPAAHGVDAGQQERCHEPGQLLGRTRGAQAHGPCDPGGAQPAADADPRPAHHDRHQQGQGDDRRVALAGVRRQEAEAQAEHRRRRAPRHRQHPPQHHRARDQRERRRRRRRDAAVTQPQQGRGQQRGERGIAVRVVVTAVYRRRQRHTLGVEQPGPRLPVDLVTGQHLPRGLRGEDGLVAAGVVQRPRAQGERDRGQQHHQVQTGQRARPSDRQGEDAADQDRDVADGDHRREGQAVTGRLVPHRPGPDEQAHVREQGQHPVPLCGSLRGRRGRRAGSRDGGHRRLRPPAGCHLLCFCQVHDTGR